MRKRKLWYLILLVGVLVTLSGCSGLVPHDAHDMAAKTLTQLFGLDLNQVLSPGADFGKTNYVIPILFGSLNHVLLSVLLVLFSYVCVAGTIYSAQDGTFLGKKWGKLWIPIRAVLGSVLVVPAKSGFCIAQYIMLSLIYIGIYMGSQVWSTVTDKIDNQKAIPAATAQLQHQVKTALAQLVFNDAIQPVIKEAAKCDQGASCTVDDKGVHFTVHTQSNVNDAWFKVFQSGLYQTMSHHSGGMGGYCGSTPNCQTVLSDFLNSNSNWPHPYYALTSADHKTYSQILLPKKVKEVDQYTMKLNWNLPKNSLVSQALSELKNPDKSPGIAQMIEGNYYKVGDATQGDGSKLNDDLNHEVSSIANQLIKPTYVLNLNPIPGKKPSFTSCDDTLAVGQGGWWCASNQYLRVDKELASNMQAYYKELQAFTQGEVTQTDMQAVASIPSLVMYYYSGQAAAMVSAQGWSISPMNGTSLNIPVNFKASLPGYSGGDAWSQYYTQIVALKSSLSGTNLSELNNLIAVLPAPSANGDYAAHLTALFYLRESMNPGAPIIDFSNAKDKIMVNQLYNVLRFIGDTGTWQADISSGGKTGAAFGNGGAGVSFHLLLTNLFQGLLGETHEGRTIGNIMDQLYALGTNQNCGNPVSCHFSMIQNAQVVGVNMIGGVVGAMESIYENFVTQFRSVIAGAESRQSQVEGVQIAGAVLPFLKGLSDYKNVSNQVAITVTLAGIAVNMMWLPLVFFVLTGLFVSGITFALLVPMTPYILFWAGKVTWILLVLEALIAAPLMALGIAYPDGHDVFGIAEPGIKMSFNVVLMPVLLIIGLVSGIVLTYVVVYFSAVGFHVVASNILAMLPPDQSSSVTVTHFVPQAANLLGAPDPAGNTPQMQDMTQASISRGVMSVFLIFMYGTFIALAFNKCFSTIYVFPEKILQWLGLQGGSKFGEQELGKMEQASSQSAKEGMQSGGQSITQGTQSQQGEAKAGSEAATQKGHGAAGAWGGLSQEGKAMGDIMMM